MKNLEKYIELIEQEIHSTYPKNENHQLFDPIEYILNLGGKRIRPALCLMSTELFGGETLEAIPPALAIELFHNFSLIHDDIMDKSPLRRGQMTVHLKWNIDRGILSGDALLVLAYQIIEKSDQRHLKELLKLFNTTALEVCIGQQLDMEFETRDDVQIEEYIDMIRLKTSVLIGASFKMGAICSDQSTNEGERIYSFGEKLGIAFQLRDDYLDAFADTSISGKQVGGDILSNKKTFLLLKALELGDKDQKEKINDLVHSNPEDKVVQMLAIFRELKIDELLNQEIQKYSDQAIEKLKETHLSPKSKEKFEDFANALMKRNF